MTAMITCAVMIWLSDGLVMFCRVPLSRDAVSRSIVRRIMRGCEWCS
jgi:hypothetical protein